MAPYKMLLAKWLFKADNKKEKTTLDYRVAIFGSSGVGKTALVRRLMGIDYFEEKHIPTIEELGHAQFPMRNSNTTVRLQLLDTSGTFSFPAMRDLAIRRSDAFILVYAIDDKDSFEQIVNMKNYIIQMLDGVVPPIVVVANKTDLADQRALDAISIDSMISMDWEFGHVECSAKTNGNTFRILTQLVKQKILMEKMALEKESDSDEGQPDSDVSPSRQSITSEKLFFGEDFGGSSSSLDADSRKSSMTDSELEFRLRKEFKDSNCTIS